MKINKTEMMNIRLTKEEKRILCEHAERLDVPVGQLVRHAIQSMFKGEENGNH